MELPSEGKEEGEPEEEPPFEEEEELEVVPRTVEKECEEWELELPFGGKEEEEPVVEEEELGLVLHIVG